MDARLGRALVLGAWSCLFVTLWATDRTALYLGPKTSWVVPLGAVLTGATAVVLAGRGRSETKLSRAEGWGLVAVLVPIVAVVAAPQADLGAAAAERRATGFSANGVELIDARPARSRLMQPHGPVLDDPRMYAYIMAAQGRVQQPGMKPGVRVRLTGFAVDLPGTPAGLFQVARFQINCCIADAGLLSVTIDPVRLPLPKRDSWIVVTGSLQRLGRALVLRAESIRSIPAPAHPYLSGGRALNVVPQRHGTRPPAVPGA